MSMTMIEKIMVNPASDEPATMTHQIGRNFVKKFGIGRLVGAGPDRTYAGHGLGITYGSSTTTIRWHINLNKTRETTSPWMD